MTSTFTSTHHSMLLAKKGRTLVSEYFGAGFSNPSTMAQSSTLAQSM